MLAMTLSGLGPPLVMADLSVPEPGGARAMDGSA